MAASRQKLPSSSLCPAPLKAWKYSADSVQHGLQPEQQYSGGEVHEKEHTAHIWACQITPRQSLSMPETVQSQCMLCQNCYLWWDLPCMNVPLIWMLLQVLTTKDLTVSKLPAHIGIRANEIADQLAKEGREKEQPLSHLSYREVKTLIHNKKKAIFHCKTEGYNPNQAALHQLPLHQQTIIFRLRTGHCRLISYLKRIGEKTSA